MLIIKNIIFVYILVQHFYNYTLLNITRYFYYIYKYFYFLKDLNIYSHIIYAYILNKKKD